jgi:CheY-like chemotaxis protein
MKPRILIIDDDDRVVEVLKQQLDDLPDIDSQYYGIEEFEYDEASHGDEAIRKLKQAKESSLPYSLALVDLELPRRKKNGPLEKHLGFEILNYAIEENAVLGVTVVSKYEDYKNAVKAFPGIDVDFIAKPSSQEVLQQQVLSYFEREGMRILDKRIKNLTPHAQKGLAYQLGVCFSSFVQRVVNETEGLKMGFSRRWGVDVERDKHDPQVRRLIALEKAIKSARSEWNELQSALICKDERPRAISLEKLLNEINARLLPCLLLKNVKLNNLESYRNGNKILSFDQDVNTVLTEMILGALNELPNHDSVSKNIDIFLKVSKEYAEVRLQDDFKTKIQHEDAEKINKGDISINDSEMGRVWGLSLAQYIALRGGGRLMVEPRDNGGSLITYRIPLARHA